MNTQNSQTIPALVERFSRQIESYQQSTYNETQTRREFIDPFFIALGWDVANEQGYAEAYKDSNSRYNPSKKLNFEGK